MSKLSVLFAAICREPYRLFFPLGVMAGTMGVMPWFLYAVGLTHSYSGQFHSSLQTMVYMNLFIAGFLMTALPRFTSSIAARGWEVLTVLMIFLAIGFFLAIGQWVAAELLVLGWYAFLMYFALIRVLKRPRTSFGGSAPLGLIWVPIGILHGVIGISLMVLGQLKILPAWSLMVGKPMMDQGFLTSLVLGVGSFLIVRLMGVAQPSIGNIRVQMTCGLVFFLSYWVEGLGYPSMGYLLRAAVASIVFYAADILYQWPKSSALYVRMVWASAWMVVLGFWGAALWGNYQVVLMHLTYLGGFSLMTFAVGSMVIMSHAGHVQKLQTGIWALWILVSAVVTALAYRLAVAFWPDLYFQLLGFAAASWMVGAWVWLCYMLPMVCLVPNEDEFGKMHEAAKANVNMKDPC